jgi:hypothetical protein
VRTYSKLALAAALAFGTVFAAAAPASQVLVVCAPGSPGTTKEAQPRMDAFAAALSTKARTAVQVIYEPSDTEGAKRVTDAGLAIVSLPFFLAHETALGLHARLAVVQAGRSELESWTLVAQKGRITRPEQLAGFTIASTAGFAPGFVRGAVQAQFGPLPEDVKIVQSKAVLSMLRRAAQGDSVAVLLDSSQAAALSSLPYAAKLAPVMKTPAWPSGLVVTAGRKLPPKEWAPIESALLGLGGDRAEAAALAGLEIKKFAPLDNRALADASGAYASTK